MRGADEYVELFDPEGEQEGQLFFVPGSHARGDTFRIFVLPPGEPAKRNGPGNGPLNSDAVEVYGITGGQHGWTETYGWLHEGLWQEDFRLIVEERRRRIEGLLSKYVSPFAGVTEGDGNEQADDGG